ncbi:hypothetical protein UABAM_04718 [Candidatus Uabimicrobium amorphum]|uniref:Uncharacterized protein n=1 Tax=Uabimicrobium amorphum TaxID=2596890 RepID=A0A5S9IRX5_UABAM|nr:hypothetical protein UABAM_04718 [Candidatus Uabimicrobium amorphum]
MYFSLHLVSYIADVQNTLRHSDLSDQVFRTAKIHQAFFSHPYSEWTFPNYLYNFSISSSFVLSSWLLPLWKSYLKEDQSLFIQKDVELLSKSTEKYILDTVAAIYAWQGNAMLAYKYADIAEKETLKRVKLLLEGKTPKQVEQEMKK